MAVVLPNGQVTEDLDVVGITDYGARIDGNTEKLATNIQVNSTNIAQLANTNVGSQADAINNIQNLVVNGEFKLATSAPRDQDDIGAAGLEAAICRNTISNRELVPYADFWFVNAYNNNTASPERMIQPRSLGDGTTPAPLVDHSTYQGGMKIYPGPGVFDADSAYVYQRMDAAWDLEFLRGKTVTFGILYESSVDDQLFIEVDDGITTTNNDPRLTPGTMPLGVNSRVIQHVIDPSATKLTVRVYCIIAPTLGSEPVVQKAVMKLGASNFVIDANTAPQDIGRDLTLVQMFHKQVIVGEEAVPHSHAVGPKDGAGGELYTHDFQWYVPLVEYEPDTIVQYVEPAAAIAPPDDRDVTLLGTPPTFEIWNGASPGTDDWFRNPTNVVVDKGIRSAYRKCRLVIERVAGDPAPAAGRDGFVFRRMVGHFNVICTD